MCGEGMTLTRCADRSDLFKWECRKQEKEKRHKAEISIRKGSWFEKKQNDFGRDCEVDILVVPES